MHSAFISLLSFPALFTASHDQIRDNIQSARIMSKYVIGFKVRERFSANIDFNFSLFFAQSYILVCNMASGQL